MVREILNTVCNLFYCYKYIISIFLYTFCITHAMDEGTTFVEVSEDSIDVFSRAARVLIAGGSDSGKSFLATKLILKYHKKFEVILICGIAHHELQTHPEISSKIVVSEEIVSPVNYKTKDSDRVLFVLDDCYNTALSSELVSNLFTRGRHVGVSLILVVQNIYSKGKFARDITLNCTHIILLKIRDLQQIQVIARQCFGVQRSKEFLQIYKEVVVNTRFGYILLDLSPHTRTDLQMRTHIVDEEKYELVLSWD